MELRDQGAYDVLSILLRVPALSFLFRGERRCHSLPMLRTLPIDGDLFPRQLSGW